MRFGSVCSGIEAASVALHPFGWETAWLAEIEPFPSAVLAHHYPGVPNLGDMTALPAAVLSGKTEAPDVLIGGTPCQAFSVAGMRRGMTDPRGLLTIRFVELADAIDHVRTARGDDAGIIWWENVPGVLSDKENAFGCFLAALVGESEPLLPAGGRWTDAGCVYGPKRTVAWRVLDAQYFGLAQRRRRVFVIASARAGFDPAAVLFESDSVRRDSAPSRETRERVAPTLAARTRGGGGLGTDFDCDGGLIPAWPAEVACTLNAAFGDKQGLKDQHSLAGASLFVPHTAHTLRADGFDASKDGTGRGAPLVPVSIALRGRDGGATAEMGDEVAFALRASSGGGDKPHVLIHAETMPTLRAGAPNGGAWHGARSGDSKDEYIVPVGFHWNAQPDQQKFSEEQSATPTCSQGAAVAQSMAVRRLTPTECERLQGFPDSYTAIPLRKKTAEQCPDGPRYKALGNSMAVPCMAWIGGRIHELTQEQTA